MITNNCEYYIHKVACALLIGLEISDIIILLGELSNEEQYLVIKAGRILADDYNFDPDDYPTKPGG